MDDESDDVMAGCSVLYSKMLETKNKVVVVVVPVVATVYTCVFIVRKQCCVRLLLNTIPLIIPGDLFFSGNFLLNSLVVHFPYLLTCLLVR